MAQKENRESSRDYLPVLPYPLLTAVRVRPRHSLSKAVRDLSRFTPAGEGGMKLRLIRTVRNTFVPGVILRSFGARRCAADFRGKGG